MISVSADMKPGSVTAEEQERIESNKQELDRFLGAYPYERSVLFCTLTVSLIIDIAIILAF